MVVALTSTAKLSECLLGLKMSGDHGKTGCYVSLTLDAGKFWIVADSIEEFKRQGEYNIVKLILQNHKSSVSFVCSCLESHSNFFPLPYHAQPSKEEGPTPTRIIGMMPT